LAGESPRISQKKIIGRIGPARGKKKRNAGVGGRAQSKVNRVWGDSDDVAFGGGFDA